MSAMQAAPPNVQIKLACPMLFKSRF